MTIQLKYFTNLLFLPYVLQIPIISYFSIVSFKVTDVFFSGIYVGVERPLLQKEQLCSS